MSREEQPATSTEETTVTITATAPAVEIIRGETITIGNPQFYTNRNFPAATLVTIPGDGAETFLEINGTLYSQCGYCDNFGTKTYHRGVHGGVCFQCNGRGYDREIGTVEAAAKRVHNRALRQARAARRAAEQAAATEAEGNAWRAANADLADMLEAIYAELAEAHDTPNYEVRDALEARWPDFILNMANQVGMGRPLTEKQTAAVADAIEKALQQQAAEQAARDAQRHLGAPGDVVTMTGTVAVSSSHETRFGWSWLMIVEGTGEFTGTTVKLWSSAKAVREAERGDAVTVTGTVKAHSEYDGTKQTELARVKVTAA